MKPVVFEVMLSFYIQYLFYSIGGTGVFSQTQQLHLGICDLIFFPLLWSFLAARLGI